MNTSTNTTSTERASESDLLAVAEEFREIFLDKSGERPKKDALIYFAAQSPEAKKYIQTHDPYSWMHKCSRMQM